METILILFLILVIFIALLVTVLGLLLISGLGYEPTVDYGSPWISECTIAYKFVKGPYNSYVVGSTFTEITSIAPKAQTIGIFYDDPDVVPEHELRSVAACIIKREPTPSTSTDPIREDVKNTTENTVNLLKEKGFSLFKLPFVDSAVITKFPYTTPFSLWLAPRRVYPKIHHFIEARSLCAYPMVEVYSVDVIEYMAPLSKQEGFFVPEAVDVNECDSTWSSNATGESAQSSTLVSSDDLNDSVEESSKLSEVEARRRDSKDSEGSSSFEEIDTAEVEDKKDV